MSSKISSTLPLLLKFQFSNSPAHSINPLPLAPFPLALKSILSWIICKILYWCSFFLFYTFFASFVQKSIWHFGVVWLISRHWLFLFSFKNWWTNCGCERKEKYSFKHPRKCWKRVKEYCNFDSRDVILVDSLSGLKYSHEDKTKKVKLIDEELLHLLEPKEYKVE